MSVSTLRKSFPHLSAPIRKTRFCSPKKKKFFLDHFATVLKAAVETDKMYRHNPEAVVYTPNGDYFSVGKWSCSRNCSSKNCKKTISPAQAASLRLDYIQNKSFTDKKNFITNILKQSIDPTTKRAVNIPIATIPVCLNAFAAALGASPYIVAQCEEAAISGTTFHSSKRENNKPKEQRILGWIEKYLEEVADRCPVTDCYYLPMFCQWKYAL